MGAGDMGPGGFHLTPIGGGRFLFEPGPGLDTRQQDAVLEHVLGCLQRAGGRQLYYDLGGLPLIDEVYYAWLDALARACRAINVRLVCVRMRPTAAFALAHVLKGPPAFDTALGVDV